MAAVTHHPPRKETIVEDRTITLTDNQSALILETDEDGTIDINVASPDHNGLSGALCQAIAYKLANDETFQTTLMDMIDFDGQETT